MADEIERLLFGGAKPPLFGWSLFGCDERIQCIVPCARCNTRIAARQISFGDLKIQVRVAQRLVLGQDDLFGRLTIFGLKTRAFAALSIDTIESASSNSARGQAIPCFHRLHLQAYEKRFRECYDV